MSARGRTTVYVDVGEKCLESLVEAFKTNGWVVLNAQRSGHGISQRGVCLVLETIHEDPEQEAGAARTAILGSVDELFRALEWDEAGIVIGVRRGIKRRVWQGEPWGEVIQEHPVLSNTGLY